jgi:Trypsin-co-occurring domain 2
MIELSQVIRDLRAELVEAMKVGQGETLQFALGPIEVELSVAVEKKGGAGVKVRFWVVEAGGEGGLSKADTQRIKLVLHPQLAGAQGSVKIADEAPPTVR